MRRSAGIIATFKRGWMNPTGHYAGSPDSLTHALVTVEHVAPILVVILVAVWALSLAVGRARRRRLARGRGR